jgi:hypothetical protein
MIETKGIAMQGVGNFKSIVSQLGEVRLHYKDVRQSKDVLSRSATEADPAGNNLNPVVPPRFVVALEPACPRAAISTKRTENGPTADRVQRSQIPKADNTVLY